ncbi:hypothetical protein NDU88_001030 [Pleurodeles waltl]|uniref:Uncharacterized protein n=1 Tax=Pleurodeles waltl TaxID=8319 RepID=A0AAV7SBD6_PLEWA|nr:hypothetical protein NDU88_001030 [Pleurodeles waltl]
MEEVAETTGGQGCTGHYTEEQKMTLCEPGRQGDSAPTWHLELGAAKTGARGGEDAGGIHHLYGILTYRVATGSGGPSSGPRHLDGAVTQ